VTGTVALGNTSYGVVMGTNTSNTTVGGTAAGAGNVISGNTLPNVRIHNSATASLVLGNIIGLNAAGTAAVPNGSDVVSTAAGAPNNTMGGPGAGAGTVLAGNNGSGVVISDAGATGNVVQGNKSGTTAAGTAGIANSGDGVRFPASTSNNMVGGTAA